MQRPLLIVLLFLYNTNLIFAINNKKFDSDVLPNKLITPTESVITKTSLETESNNFKFYAPLVTSVYVIKGISCFGSTDAEIDVFVTGGTAPYVYELLDEFSNTVIIPTQANNTFVNLAQGVYSVRVTDNNGDQSYSNLVTIIEPTILETTLISTNANCAQGGSIIINASGGSLSYEYSLDGINYTANNEFTNLTAGNYSATVKDTNGCIVISSFVIFPPEELTMETQVTNVNCNGEQTGSIEVLTVTGGTPPYVYSLDQLNYQNNTVFESLSAGEYTVATKDANGCIFVEQVEIETPSIISAEVTITNVSCMGQNDGSIIMTTSGGTLPYEYSLDGINYTANNEFTNLISGNYNATGRDANGCTFISSFTILSPAELTMETQVANVNCNGEQTGSIDVLTVTGGTPPYVYSLDQLNYQNNTVFESLSAGEYTVATKDANGCTVLEQIEISTFTLLAAEITTTNISCLGKTDGGIIVTASGGSLPYKYSLDGINYTSDYAFIELPSSMYIVWVKDTNGCILNIAAEILAPNQADFDMDGIGDACDDDIDGDGVINILDQCPETPLQNLVDVNGCIKFSLPSSDFTVQATAETCSTSNNGSILISAKQDFDYSAVLTSENISLTKSFRNFTSFQDLEAGKYNICITVINEPSFERCFKIQISEPENLEVDTQIDTTAKAITLKMKGGDYYTILINEKLYSTYSEEITLPLTKSKNVVTVKTAKDCQGVYEQIVQVAVKDISIYPNPVIGKEVSVLLPYNSEEKVNISLYANDGRLVLNKQVKNMNTPIVINVNSLLSGVYILKIETPTETYSRQIIIK